MISLRKPLGSLESPAASGAGLSPLVDMLELVGWGFLHTFSYTMAEMGGAPGLRKF